MRVHADYALALAAIWIISVHPGSAQNTDSKDIQKKTSSGQNVPTLPIPVPQQPKEGQESATSKAADGIQRSVSISGPVTVKSGKDNWDRLLVISTTILVAVGFLQIFFLWRTVLATSENAKAARLGAQAVISSERPWMVVNPIERKPQLLFIPEPGDPVGMETARNAFAVKIVSAGRTPAKIIRSGLDYVMVENLSQLPAIPQYTNISLHDGLVMIPREEPIGRVAFLQPKAILSKAEAKAIMNKDAFVYAYGFVEYGCVFDCATCPHVVRFGYVYNFPQGGEPQILTGFMPGGPSAYNAST
jgi:hypothetical protein